jgi:uncharacterized repeat protein (TIGR01451 family)/fimbrial isopeptide formation D2 family protein
VTLSTPVLNGPGSTLPTKEAGSTVILPGQTITYTINVKNGGTIATNPLTIDDALPLGLTLVAGSAIATIDGNAITVSTTGSSTNPLFTITAPVNPGSTATLTFQVLVPQSASSGENITNTLLIKGYPDDPGTGVGTPVPVVVKTPNFKTTKTTTVTTIKPGGSVPYTITSINTSEEPAATLTLTDKFPRFMTLDPAIVPTAIITTATGVRTSVTPTVGGSNSAPSFTIDQAIHAGDTVVVSYNGLVSLDASIGGLLVNKAVATFTDDAGTSYDYSKYPSSTTITVTPPDISKDPFTKTASIECLDAGNGFSYVLTFTNLVKNTSGFTVTDSLPEGLTFPVGGIAAVSIDARNYLAENTGTEKNLIFQIPGPISANGTVTITIDVESDSHILGGTTITNTASISNSYSSVTSNAVPIDVAYKGLMVAKYCNTFTVSPCEALPLIICEECNVASWLRLDSSRLPSSNQEIKILKTPFILKQGHTYKVCYSAEVYAPRKVAGISASLALNVNGKTVTDSLSKERFGNKSCITLHGAAVIVVNSETAFLTLSNLSDCSLKMKDIELSILVVD